MESKALVWFMQFQKWMNYPGQGYMKSSYTKTEKCQIQFCLVTVHVGV
jgi:hypothetical protein